MLNHLATLEQIALYLGKPWKLNRSCEHKDYRAEIIDGTGRAIVFRLEKDKFKVSRCYPHGTRAQSGDYKTIGVSTSRRPKDIADDINRRLLIGYQEAFEAAKACFQEEQDREERLDFIARNLALVTLGHISKHHGRGQRTVYFPDGEAQIFGFCEEINLSFRNTSPEQAIKLAGYFGKLKQSQKFEVQTYTLCDGWVNTWHVCEHDGEASAQVFDSEEEAQAELDEFFKDIEREIESGQRQPDEGYDRSEFRIVPVTK